MNNPELLNTLIFPILNQITEEYGYKYSTVSQLDDLPGTLRVHFVDEKTHTHLSHLFNLRAVEMSYEPPLFFSSAVRTVLEEWKKGDQHKKYRDILVEQIKSAGQQLINRAEEMVSEKLTFVTGFTINVDIPQPADRPVSISWTAETIDTNQLK